LHTQRVTTQGLASVDDPKRIKILGKYYKVIPTDQGDYGICNTETCEIHLRQNQNHQQKKDTLLHECIHAIDDAMQLNLTEEQVFGMAGGVYALLHDNKHFAKWLMERTHAEE